GELPLFVRWRVGRHVRHCANCEQQVALFHSAKAELKREAASQTLTGFEAIADWSRLEQEMLGNIGVGVAAARCIENVHAGRKILIRVAFAAGLTAFFVGGWMTHIAAGQTQHLFASLRRAVGVERPPITGTELRTTPDGIAVRTEGATLRILHPPSAVVSLSGRSSVAARYVDEETGELTITKVYAQ